MKKYVLIIFALSWMTGISAQVDIGTIVVSTKYTVSLQFPDPIEFVIWGNNPVISQGETGVVYANYDQFQSDKTLILKAKKGNLEKTSLTVKSTDGTLWFGFVENANSDKLFYDFTGQGQSSQKKSPALVLIDEKPTETGTISSPIVKPNFEEKLKKIMGLPAEYLDFGIVQNNLTFMVTNIMNDTDNSYLKIIINNKSGNAFVINSVIFKYTEGKNKGVKKNVIANEERLMPVYSKTEDLVPAYSKVELGYVLPLYSTGENGKFLIQFIEDKGTRNYQIEILSKDLKKIKILEI